MDGCDSGGDNPGDDGQAWVALVKTIKELYQRSVIKMALVIFVQ